MIEATKKFFTEFGDFKGCTNRNDFWNAILGVGLLSFFASLILNAIGLSFVSYVLSVTLSVGSLSLWFRRFHDVNKSALNLLWSFLPLFGVLVIIHYACKKSVIENNKYRQQ